MSRFTHLHTHSHYSLLNALPKVEELVDRAKEEGMTALALTDNGSMYGIIDFYKACKKAGIKPIIGVDAYLAARTRFDKQAGIDNRRTRLLLLARTKEGYRNLIKLVTDSFLEGFYYKPRIDRELIEKYKEGLLAISPSWSSDISVALRNGDSDKAKELVAFYKQTYGNDAFFLELTHHPELEGHSDLMKKIKELAKETDTPLVAAHEVYYLTPDDKKARETLMMVNQNGEGGSRDSTDTSDFSFIGEEKICSFFKDTPEAVQNTQKIADMCSVELELGTWVFPNYKTQSGLPYDEELHRLVYEGVEKRGLEKTPELVERIEYELKVIRDKGYAPYFLVVSDLLRFAHENKILTTIRGSVAGSMVTYLARITNVNPFVYKLPFERFLNPERPSAPDIDMDYADNRRDEMIQYAKSKYGEDHVAQIGTFGTMMARGSVRDVARALGFEYSVGDNLAKLIPMGSQGFPMTIDKALEIVPELKELYEKEDSARQVIDMAKKIEGCARHISVHAAGVVISPTPLTDFVPLQFDPKGGKIITQYDMHGVEDAGLLKFDFLGIKNLSILSDAVARVQEMEGIAVDIENVPLDDKKTFEILAKGETIGLFQLNGTGMTKYLKDLKPTTIHDINAMVALYRPGPMESIPQYIERKHNPKLVTYLDPRMKDILTQSYGVITYQDDVMMIAIKLAGYSWLEADKLRKAMGKKIPAEMEAQKVKLFEGFVKNGMTKEKASALWKLIEPFAAYGFNKAHAASYGKVAYQTAYMKANFPAIYMASVLTADSGDVEKIGETIAECTRMGLPVLPPDINESFQGFTVIKGEADASGKRHDKIRFGLTTIKNFGEGIATTIINERARGGKFTSLAHFLERIKDRNLNKKSLEALIKAGALDAFGDRGVLLENTEELLSYNKEQAKGPDHQDSLFGLFADTSSVPALRLAEGRTATMAEKLAWEKELLGLYISGHPLDKYRSVLGKQDKTIKHAKLEGKEGMTTVIAGIIEEVKPITTKKNDQMAFVRIADFSDTLEVVIFPKIYTEFKNLLLAEKCIAIKGKISTRNGEISLIADKLKELS